jgi:hypothetical protein
VSARLCTWSDALVWDLVDRAFECGRDQERTIPLCREFELRYYRLSADELLAAREAEITKGRAA